MKKIKITMVIEDQETVEAYKDVHPDMIYDDLLHGSLMGGCVVVDVEVIEDEL